MNLMENPESSQSPPPPSPSYQLADDAGTIAAVSERLAHLTGETIVGLDTETCWNPGAASSASASANNSKASLIQIAGASGPVLIVDVLAVGAEIVRPLVESPAVLMVAHNARFDEGVLRGEGLQPVGFVDTLSLARAALRLPSYSLKEVAAHLLGVALNKSFQRSNWRRRPLSRRQLEYAALDARVTLDVYHALCRILDEQGRLERALAAATLRPPDATTGERSPRTRRSGAPKPKPRPLTPEESRAFKQLKIWRLERANRTNVPAYRVCPDATLEHLVCSRPSTLDALRSIYGLGDSRVAAFGDELLDALRRALG